MRVLFVVPYPRGEAPSQRFRFEHYLGEFAENRIAYRYSSFWDAVSWKVLYKPGHRSRKIWGLLKGFARRFLLLFSLPFYQFVFIHREATPLGPAWFEWVAKHIFRKKIIYDFDDAIWIPAVSKVNKAVSKLRNFKKVSKICAWSYRISVGNKYLGQFAGKYNKNVVVIPTVVDTENTHNLIQNQEIDGPAIGWTGTFSTLPYLEIVLPVLQQLQEKFDFHFVVIADKDPELPLKKYKFIKWAREKETADLLHFHIGLMPLYDDEISKGKCGFKAIQYMALGIPAVVSPVGVNTEIVGDGLNGFICNEPSQWSERLEQLLTDSLLRKKLGIAARHKIEKAYSVKATTRDFFKLFN